jgi:hypothetical protein
MSLPFPPLALSVQSLLDNPSAVVRESLHRLRDCSDAHVAKQNNSVNLSFDHTNLHV